MNTDQTETNLLQPAEVMAQVKSYLADAELRHHELGNDAIELYMQGDNLTMQVLIYVHNGHLILRVPGFIRNIDLRQPEILHFLLEVMNDILDIRFEISKDGKGLSACCQHIIEDTMVSRRQFDLAFMVLIHIVDDTYPHLMKLLYQDKSGNFHEQTQVMNEFAADIDEISEDEENTENEDTVSNNNPTTDRKIN